MNHYYFYILYSKSLDHYYSGCTSNLIERLRKHNSKHNGFTGKANDWEIVYTENFHSRKEAGKREYQVKKWKNRLRIQQLIQRQSEHPD